MNKLFKLIYINLLDLFDINKIIVAREDGVKSNLEKRVIIMGIISLFYGYIFYLFLTDLNLNDNYLMLSIGFIVATLLCFASDLTNVESAIFKSEDNDILFSFPISRYHILFSKLFVIYLKNLLMVAIVMVSSFLVFYNLGEKITDTMVLMYILGCLIIPLLPIVIATLLSYVKDYYKVKYNNSLKFKIVKNLISILLIILISLLFIDIKISDLNTGIPVIIERLNYIIPLNYLFYNAIKNEHLISFVFLIAIPILVTYLYMLVINNNYIKICSQLKGIKKKEEFKYKKTRNYGRVFGMIKKEYINMFSSKYYLINSFGTVLLLTIILIVGLNLIDIEALYQIERMDEYIDLFLPTILATMVSLGCSTISAMSLEKNNMQMLRTMPLSMGNILFSKWLVNILGGLIFIIINGSVVWYFLKYDMWNVLFSYLLPFLALLFVSLTGLVLDYRFIVKNENDEHVIIRQRLLTMVPTFLAILIGICPLFIGIYTDYRYVLGSYMVVMVIAIIIELIYLVINKKKLLKNLFS